MVSTYPRHPFFHQIKLPFEKLIHALRNFPEDAMNPDTLLPMAYSVKVCPLILQYLCQVANVLHYTDLYSNLDASHDGQWCGIFIKVGPTMDMHLQSSGLASSI